MHLLFLLLVGPGFLCPPSPLPTSSKSDDKKKVEVTCPVDGTKFTATEITVTNQWGGVDYDFCPHAFKTTPLEHRVWVCPSCCFAGLKKDFDATFDETQKKRLRENLAPFVEALKSAGTKNLPGHVKFDLLAQVALILRSGNLAVGRAYLNASWSCRQQGAIRLRGFDEWTALLDRHGINRTPIQIGRRNRTDYDLAAAAKVEKAIQEKKYERGVNRLLARYLAAYLYRKHGENEPALKWLGTLASLEGENSIVADAAKRMRASISMERDFQKKAVEAYTAALGEKEHPPQAAAEITYLLGELNRRLGEREKAAECYRKVIDGVASEGLKKLATDRFEGLEK